MGQIDGKFKRCFFGGDKVRTNVRLGIDIARLFEYTWDKLGNKRSLFGIFLLKNVPSPPFAIRHSPLWEQRYANQDQIV